MALQRIEDVALLLCPVFTHVLHHCASESQCDGLYKQYISGWARAKQVNEWPSAMRWTSEQTYDPFISLLFSLKFTPLCISFPINSSTWKVKKSQCNAHYKHVWMSGWARAKWEWPSTMRQTSEQTSDPFFSCPVFTLLWATVHQSPKVRQLRLSKNLFKLLLEAIYWCVFLHSTSKFYF